MPPSCLPEPARPDAEGAAAEDPAVGIPGVEDPAVVDPELLDRARRAAARERELAAAVRADPDRPRYHLAPPVGRLNDPNGLVHLDGRWHAFYQYSPLHPEKAVFWRHAVSEDLLRWRDLGTALEPVRWYDRDGCYSGGALPLPGGGVEFYYTGNVRTRNGGREAYQCRAVPAGDGSGRLLPDPDNPLIPGPPPGYTAHFRDPQVLPAPEGGWMMLLGAQREDGTGAILRWDSADRRRWGFTGELRFDRPELRAPGFMDECPQLVRLRDEETGEDRHVLIFCPQGLGPEGERFRNPHPCAYTVGVLKGCAFREATALEELDAGFEFYAPQVFAGTGERTVLMGWLGNAGEDDQPSLARGWVHQMTLPRELVLRGGRLFQRPMPEADRLLPLRELDLPDADAAQLIPPQPRPAHRLRVEVSFEGPSAGAVPDPASRLEYLDPRGIAVTVSICATGITVDRGGSRYQAGGPERTRTLPAAGHRAVELFADSSSLEIFAEDGACVFTQRIFLTGPVAVTARCDAGARLLSAEAALLPGP